MKKQSYSIKFKKAIISLKLLGVFLLSSTTLSAQEAQSSTTNLFSYGVKAGGTLSSFSQEQPHSNKIAGIAVGLFTNYSLSNRIALQFEINYNEEGGRLLSFDIPENTGKQTWYTTKINNNKVCLHNLNIPLLFRYNFRFQNYRVYSVLGPNLSINLKSVVEDEGLIIPSDGGFIPFNQSTEISAKIENFTYSVSGGMGIEIPLNNTKYLVFDVRLKYGLTNVYKGYSYVKLLQNSDHLKNNSLTVSIGYGF